MTLATAKALGVNQATVSRDANASGDKSGTAKTKALDSAVDANASATRDQGNSRGNAPKGAAGKKEAAENKAFDDAGAPNGADEPSKPTRQNANPDPAKAAKFTEPTVRGTQGTGRK